MPDRTPAQPYDGPERRKHHRRVEDRPPIRHGWFTTWQWVVLFAFFALAVQTVVIGHVVHRANENARHGNAAICVVAAFLDNSVRTTEALVKAHPGAPENAARVEGARRVRVLTDHLHAEIPSCDEALQ